MSYKRKYPEAQVIYGVEAGSEAARSPPQSLGPATDREIVAKYLTFPSADEEGRLPKGVLEELSEEITAYFEDCRSTQADHVRRRRFVDTIQKIADSNLPGSRVLTFGSSVTGLSKPSSDLDLTVVNSKQFGDAKSMARRCLPKLMSGLKRERICPKVNFIANAAVPILKCTGGEYEFDVSCNTTDGVDGARIIKYFIALDPRVGPLLFALQDVAQRHGLKDAPRQMLSAFAINISAIHFLQYQCKPSVLPYCSFERDVPGEVELREEGKLHEGENRSEVGELLVGYMRWMRHTLRFARTRGVQVWVDIRDASSRTEDVISLDRDADQDKIGLAIVNPIDPTKDVARNIKTRHFSVLERKFEDLLTRPSALVPGGRGLKRRDRDRPTTSESPPSAKRARVREGAPELEKPSYEKKHKERKKKKKKDKKKHKRYE